MASIIVLEWFGISLVEYVVLKQHEFINVVQELGSGSGFRMTALDESYMDLLSHLPMALVSALIRPFPLEVHSLPEVLMMIENFTLWLIFVLAGWQLYKGKRASNPPLLWVVLFVLPVLLLTGLVTPVFGAIMRYRAPVIVVLIIVLSPYIRSVFPALKRNP